MNAIPEHVQGIYAVIYYFSFNLAKAVLAFLQRDSYLYWPFILSTLVVMLFMAQRAAGGEDEPGSWRKRLRGYFSAGVWWHPSARADYRLYFANALLLPLVFGWLLFGDAQFGALLDAAAGRQPAAAQPAAGGMLLRLLYTAAFFVAYDFGRFVAHCVLHDIPALWEFHKVHHSAEVLTPMTAYRAHPVDLLVMAWVPLLATGLTTWVFNIAAGGAVGFYAFLGLHVALWAVNLVDNLRHSHVWVTYGTALGRWVVSPAHHQLHHSCEERHIGCNRGFSLAVWDRLYGTLRLPEAQAEKFRMGLGDGSEPAWHSVTHMYLAPFGGLFRKLRGLLRSRVTR